MKSKSLKILLVSAMAVLMQSSFAEDTKVIKWKLATSWPGNLSPMSDAPKNFAQKVKAMSNGRLIIKIHDKNKHKAPLGVLDMVKAGQYDMGHSGSYYWKGKDLATVPITTMPFGMTAAERLSWYYNGDGKALTAKVYDKFNVLSYPGGNLGNQMGGWFKKEINSVEDLKGLKMRIPGFAGEVMSKLGVAVTNIAAGELYTSLERGTIDALEWVGPGMDISMGFHKVAEYYYTGWHEPASDLQYLINKKSWNKLPDDLKTIVETAMESSNMRLYAQNYKMSADAWAKMKADYPNIKVKTFPKEVIAKLRQINDELIIEKSKESPLFKEIVENQRAFMKKARVWTKISDYQYLKDDFER